MGDEHRERDAPIITIRGLCGGDPFTFVNASADRFFYRDLTYGNTSQYTCTSDQYTDTHVYAHGDDGDRAGE